MPEPYKGDVDCHRVWARLREAGNAVLVDVRTKAEWTFVGVPDLSACEKAPILVEWQSFPSMHVNPDFVDEVRAKLGAHDAADVELYFLCRSGARSRSAAIVMAQAGYQRCANVAAGFEGPVDELRHRGRATGWKADGLPWAQS